jgi:hypothetical protein
VQNHRDVWAFGHPLPVGSNEGDDAKRDNGLVIIGGRYGPCGAGHLMVLNGVNAGTGQISRGQVKKA